MARSQDSGLGGDVLDAFRLAKTRKWQSLLALADTPMEIRRSGSIVDGIFNVRTIEFAVIKPKENW